MAEHSAPPVHYLMVDDREENLIALEAVLRRDELVLVRANSGAEALEAMLEYDFALALIDVQMPEMNGFELAELMRGTERTKRIPIIFLTAAGDDKQRRFRGYETGAVDFLHKPIEPDILKSKAEVFFELYRQREEVSRQRDELKSLLEENSRLLEQTREYADALKKADRRKDEFLATLAHELRNPLAPILNAVHLVRWGNLDPSEYVEVHEIVERQVQHMVRLIDDLLDLSRITRDKIELRREIVSLQDVARNAVETSTPIIEANKHHLTTDLPPQPIRVEGDAVRLAQVISNLLNNAAKYTPEGGQIDLLVSSTGNMATVSVRDNGVGIPAEMLADVFGMFTQVSQHLPRAQGGLGIGLTLVKRLVEMHHGRIEARSEGEGQGTEFIVFLPMTTAPASQENETSAEVTGKPLR